MSRGLLCLWGGGKAKWREHRPQGPAAQPGSALASDQGSPGSAPSSALRSPCRVKKTGLGVGVGPLGGSRVWEASPPGPTAKTAARAPEHRAEPGGGQAAQAERGSGKPLLPRRVRASGGSRPCHCCLTARNPPGRCAETFPDRKPWACRGAAADAPGRPGLSCRHPRTCEDHLKW